MIYLSRFLLIPLAIPANVIAGGSGYGWRRFLTCDIAGELTWLALYGGLGYACGNQWQVVVQIITQYSTYLLGLVIIGGAIYVAGRYLRPAQVESPKLSLVR